ncbi:hypothetical protein [Microcoleus sp. S13_B4]|uniref:hypothetical protein n=1 Tax=Microcoleus sp. S13_B4 TaxID=3055408 RepID=UPI002FD32D25
MSIQCYPHIGKGMMYRHRTRKPHSDFLLWLKKFLGLQRIPHIPAPSLQLEKLAQPIVDEEAFSNE